MANNNIEIKIQVNVENSKPLIEFLEKNSNFQSEKHQVDEYFSPAHRDFIATRPVAEWLRLRKAEGKYSFNYKNWHFDKNGKSHYCDEFETKIENKDVKDIKTNIGSVDQFMDNTDALSYPQIFKKLKIWSEES